MTRQFGIVRQFNNVLDLDALWLSILAVADQAIDFGAFTERFERIS